MYKILSFLLAFFLFFNLTGVVLAQTSSPSATAKATSTATVSATTKPAVQLTKTPAATNKAAVKTLAPTAAPFSINSVLGSMPKASFVILIVVLIFLAIEIYILKRKKSEEKVERIEPDVIKGTVPGNKNTKKILTFLILIFILISIPLTLFLVKQRQEVRKKASGPAVCCKITAKNLCSGSGLGSFDLFVREFATEAQCDAYLQNPEPQYYSCNCAETCTTGPQDCPDQPPCPGHDQNQTCPGYGGCNEKCGKSTCTTSSSVDFRKEIVNQEACTTTVTTPPPTSPPTARPTAPPTTIPTNPPTTAPTSPPTSAPTAPPTTAPTNPPNVLSCNQGPCNVAGASCASGLVCAADYGYVCRKNECQIESDCTCKTALSCNQGPCNVANAGCTSGLVCIHDTWFGHDQWVCRTNECQIESDCICKQAVSTPQPPVGAPGYTAKPYVPPAQVPSTPLPPVIPQAGIDGPTFMTITAGVVLLITGLALAL